MPVLQKKAGGILQYYTTHSLTVILLAALSIRLLAVFFSQGYAFNDDHFDVITVAQHWLDGLPHWFEPDNPPRHSLFYVGLHYVLFYLTEAIGLSAPNEKMLAVRLIHGLYSLLIVFFGYKISLLLGTRKTATRTAWVLALLWFMPFMSVRNLVEMVCIPPYLAGLYLMLKATHWKQWLLAGLLFGLAFVIRYQSVLFLGGAGLVVLYRRQWRAALWISLGFLLSSFAIQGTIDLLLYRYPFHSVVSYFAYNKKTLLIIGPAYRYLLTIAGFLVPPISLLLMAGWLRARKVSLLLFWASMAFFLFHSFFPHKQERFIFPLLPLIIILGIVGWFTFYQHKPFWQRRKRFLSGSWNFFWAVNLVTALALAFTFSKKSRIAPLQYLAKQPDASAFILESSEESVPTPPLFYLSRQAATAHDLKTNADKAWGEIIAKKQYLNAGFTLAYLQPADRPLDELRKEIAEFDKKPAYIVFSGRTELEKRLTRMRQLFPRLQPVLEIEPSLYDQALHHLNPRVHEDEHISIYRIED